MTQETSTPEVLDAAPAEPPVQRATVNLPAVQGQYSAEVQEMLDRLSAPSSNALRVTQAKTFILPNDTESPGPLPFVIVAFAAENRYYVKSFNRNDISPPDCTAIGLKDLDLVPYDDCIDVQASACVGCPQNEWGSDPNGGRGKACNNHRLLALLDPFAEPGSPLLKLRLSSTAITPFDGYVRRLLTEKSKMPYQVLSLVGFDPESTFSSVRVGNPRPLVAGELIEINGVKLDAERLLSEATLRQAEAQELLLTKPNLVRRETPAKPPVRGNRRAAV